MIDDYNNVSVSNACTHLALYRRLDDAANAVFRSATTDRPDQLP